MVEIPRQLSMFVNLGNGELVPYNRVDNAQTTVAPGQSLPGWKTSGAITSGEVADNPDKYSDEKPGGWN